MNAPALAVRPAANDIAPAGPPASVEAEHALLGAVLYDNDCFHLIDGPEPKHFYEPFHADLWAWVADRIGKGVLAEPLAASRHFENDTAANELGGLDYLARMIADAPPAANAPQYAREIVELATRRELLRIAAETFTNATEAVEIDEAIAHASRQLTELEAGTDGDHWATAGAAVRAALEHAQTRTGRIDYPTGIPSLDRFTGGLNAGEMTILAARPGMGKTVAALSIARANAEHGLGVCFFSLEMTKPALAMRLACDVSFNRSAPVFSGEPTCPTFDKAMKGELSTNHWRTLAEAAQEIDGLPLVIDDRSGLTMARIEAAARRQHRAWARGGIQPGPVIIDHLGKVRPPTDRKGSKHAEVADVSGEAQVMAKRLGVPVLALVQLNRGVEGREDKRPMLSDLRQAGELEEDARQVMFLFRPEYYCREGVPGESFEHQTERLEKLQACRNQLLWLVEKNSHGPRGQVLSFCEIACSAIREW